MPAEQDKAVAAQIADFDQAIDVIERAQKWNDGRALARAIAQARITLYTVSRHLEHMQPNANQSAMIDERMDRLARWLGE